MSGPTFSRYTVSDITKGRFYQMPKFLFEGELKKGLSNDAKVLYSLLKDRHELSLQNNWVNEKHEVYLVYTRSNMQEMLGLSDKTVKKAIDQLKKFSLMEEERLGLNRPNRIYLTAVSIGNKGFGDNPTPDTDVLRYQNRSASDSRTGGNTIHDTEAFRPNDTYINNTDSSDTESNLIHPDWAVNDRCDGIENRTYYEKIIKENISFDVMVKEKVSWKEFVENIVGIMADICSMPDEANVKVNGIFQQVSVVRKRFLQIDSGHIDYILSSLEENPSNVRNIRAYLITTIFNAPITISQYYRSKVNHDLHEGRL